MADISNSSHVDVVQEHVVQYQKRAEPPSGFVPSDFLATSYPNQLQQPPVIQLKYGDHPLSGFVPSEFIGAVYPDRLNEAERPAEGFFGVNVEPIPDAEAVPEIVRPVFPDWLQQPPVIQLKYGEHPQSGFVPSEFIGAVYPDRLNEAELPAVGFFVVNVEPIPDAEAVPEIVRPVYPDLLQQPYMIREAFAQNVEPIPDASDLTDIRFATYPDWLPQPKIAEGFFAQNVEPIPNPPAPDLVSSIYPDIIHRFPPPPPPSVFETITPQTDVHPDDYSRGWHVGDIRGWYHTQRTAAAEPYAIAATENTQTIPSGTSTVLNIVQAIANSGFPGADADPWGLIDTGNDRIVFKHPGYYLIGLMIQYFPASVGPVTGLVKLYDALAVEQRVVIQQTQAPQSNTFFTTVSPPEPVATGWFIQAEVAHSSGMDQDIGVAKLWVVRIATPRLVLPT